MENSLTVISRGKDVAIVEKAAEGAKIQYKEVSGRDITITIDDGLSDTL